MTIHGDERSPPVQGRRDDAGNRRSLAGAERRGDRGDSAKRRGTDRHASVRTVPDSALLRQTGNPAKPRRRLGAANRRRRREASGPKSETFVASPIAQRRIDRIGRRSPTRRHHRRPQIRPIDPATRRRPSSKKPSISPTQDDATAQGLLHRAARLRPASDPPAAPQTELSRRRGVDSPQGEDPAADDQTLSVDHRSDSRKRITGQGA